MKKLSNKPEQPHTLVAVIGNGFDIDLKLKTKYSDFFNSYHFQNNVDQEIVERLYSYSVSENMLYNMNVPKESFSIFNLLACKQRVESSENWFDLETELAIIAKRDISKEELKDLKVISELDLVRKQKFEKLNVDYKSFALLEQRLSDYIKTQYSLPLDRESYAYKLFSIINEHNNHTVYVDNFNYTDWDKLFQNNKLQVQYIHGTVTDESNILGIHDEVEVKPMYDYFIKTHSPKFRSNHISQHLEEADEVVFFGHSFGDTDFHYFSKLFERQVDTERAKQNMIIRIFTFDENSRRNILWKLRTMTNKKVDYLFQNCDFELYRTAQDKDRIQEYFEQLRGRLVGWRKVSKGIHVVN